MVARRTNLGLLVALVAALASGGLAFATGTGWARLVLVVHGVAGLALVTLAPWKAAIVRRGLARRRPGRWRSVGLGVAVAVSTLAGLALVTGTAPTGLPVTAMQVHVGAALAAVPLLVWHVAARPVGRPRRTDLGRRALLRAGAVAGSAGLLLAAVEGATAVVSLPGAGRRFTGSLPVDPGRMPVTSWLDDQVPAVDVAGWRLEVRAGGAARGWSYPELARFDDRVEATLDCTGGWHARASWAGVRLDRLVGDAAGTSLVVVSGTGYRRRLPRHQAGRLLLATRLDGRPLSPGHGFPARLVAPGRRGFWWVKWVVAVEVDDAPWWAQPPFPLT
jgi:Oxidoreductase molybdopterin binding domain